MENGVMINPREVKLTNWKNAPSITDLKADYEEAIASHSDHTSKIDSWISNLNGELKLKIPKGRSRLQPKLIRKQAEWRYTALTEPFLSNEDMFETAPITYEDKETAYFNKLVLNKQFRVDIDKVAFIDEYIRTATDEGTVIVKVGWETTEQEMLEDVEEAVYASPEESMAYIQELVQTGQMTPEDAQAYLASGKPVQAGTQVVSKRTVKEVANKPVLEICDYNSVVIDPSCEGDIGKAQFIIYKFTTDLSTLKKDGRYKNLDAIRPEDHDPLSEPDYRSNNTTFSFKDKPRQKFVAYEYWGFWDIDDTGIVKPIVATYVGNTLIRLEENPFPDKSLPFVVVPYLPVRKSVYGEPDGSLLEDNQNIIGAVTRGIIDLLGRSANGQIGVSKDALDLPNMAKFERGEDYRYNPNVDPNRAFYMHKYPEIPRSAIEMIGIQNAEAESLTGIKAFSNGITGESLGSSVGGIRSALDATAKRELGILRRLSKGLIKIARKIVAMNAVWLSDREIIRITNDEFLVVNRDQLHGEFDIELNISTPEVDDQKAKELAFMLQTMGNTLPPDLSKMLLADIARLRKMPKLAKQIEEYQPQPDPAAQKAQELQLALLEAQVRNEAAKAGENEVDIALKGWKAEVEKAKARNIGNEADLKDLDFVRKGEGVDHQQGIERDLIKEGNKLNLKLLDNQKGVM